MEPGALRTFVIEPGETLQHLFIDVPANASSLSDQPAQAAGAPAQHELLCVAQPISRRLRLAADRRCAGANPAALQWTLGGGTSERT